MKPSERIKELAEITDGEYVMLDLPSGIMRFLDELYDQGIFTPGTRLTEAEVRIGAKAQREASHLSGDVVYTPPSPVVWKKEKLEKEFQRGELEGQTQVINITMGYLEKLKHLDMVGYTKYVYEELGKLSKD